MSAATLDSSPPAPSASHSTGPKTPEGKFIASRNAVTHGLHSQEVVLPHLGESQADYDALCAGLGRELRPHTAVQEHYAAQIAQSLWRLRRLSRWEQHLYDGPALTDEERLTMMARVLRHDALLRRHIDRALQALRDAPTNCQNEPAPAAPSDFPLIGGRGASSCSPGPARADPEGSHPPPIRAGALRRARNLKQREKCQNEPSVTGAAQMRDTLTPGATEAGIVDRRGELFGCHRC